MAIVFTELVKKGQDTSSGGSDKYLNMIKLMTGQVYYSGSDSIQYLPYSLEIGPEYFDENVNLAVLRFSGSDYLTSVEVPEHIEIVDLDFSSCHNLTSVSLLGVEEGDFSGYEFSYCTNLKTLNLPKFTGMLRYTFVSDSNGINNLETLVIPNVYSISSNAFSGARNLKLIDFRGRISSEIPELGTSNEFYMGSGTNCTVVIPDRLYDNWTHSGNWYSLYSSAYYHFVKESEYTE